MLGLGLYLTSSENVGRPSPPAYDAAAIAYFAAMSVQPDATRKELLNALIVGLKADGVWTLLDWLGILAAHDAQAALINAKIPAQVATASGSPIFTTDRGYTGVVATNGYVETGIPSNSAGNYVQDSATLFCYVNQAPTIVAQMMGLSSGTITRVFGSAGAPIARVNGSTALTSTILNSTGFIAYAHTALNANALYRGGMADVTDSTAASSVLTASTFEFLRGSGASSDVRLGAAGWGGGLNGTQVAALNNRIATYLAAVGGT